jgi:hypothetical protein
LGTKDEFEKYVKTKKAPCVAIGLGYSEFKLSPDGRERSSSLPVLQKVKHSYFDRFDELPPSLLRPDSFVAEGAFGTSVCGTDSGGPLFCKINGEKKQFGVSSWHLKDCSAYSGWGSVFNDTVRPWIEKNSNYKETSSTADSEHTKVAFDFDDAPPERYTPPKNKIIPVEQLIKEREAEAKALEKKRQEKQMEKKRLYQEKIAKAKKLREEKKAKRRQLQQEKIAKKQKLREEKAAKRKQLLEEKAAKRKQRQEERKQKQLEKKQSKKGKKKKEIEKELEKIEINLEGIIEHIYNME